MYLLLNPFQRDRHTEEKTYLDLTEIVDQHKRDKLFTALRKYLGGLNTVKFNGKGMQVAGSDPYNMHLNSFFRNSTSTLQL